MVCICTVGSRSYSNICCNDPETGSCRDRRRSRKCGYGSKEVRKPENVVSLLQVDPIELEFGYGIIPLADVNQGGDLLDRVVMIRRQVALELGTIVPIIRLRDNIQLNPNQYIIK